MHDMHLRQPGFRYAVCAPFTNNKEYPKLMKQEIHNILTKMNQIKHFAKNPKYDGYHGGLASVVYKFIDKKNVWWLYWKWKYVKQREELHKPIKKELKN